MKYCAMCQKLVNVNETKTEWTDLSSNFWMVIGSCQECHAFLYQYLENKNEK